ncbi:MAG TPA: anaerobic glycerol-3-phosphate dehydrogenase subunit GlpA [Solirubrobacteraceae bacterium]|nr:anaerobic glycerol-3-phosphate dehydrogenase subunit GlpA [Solirubrobacteraceae bacterium]
MGALETDLLVIGGGATGAGVAWDAALRGLRVVLVDRHDLAEGTSGRFHGLLHSGARYVVQDPAAARDCIAENRILRRVAAGCIEDTGGLFVTTPWDDPQYAELFAAGCARNGVDCEEIDVARALRSEPRLNPRISRAFVVPDASIDVWKTVRAMARGARERGARVLAHHELVAIERAGDRVLGAVVRDGRGDELRIHARITVNAAGAWAGRVALLAGIEGVRVLPGRGIMIATNHRLVNTVVNRCKPPADGDILVPIRTVSVIGSTDRLTDDPDDQTVHPDEVKLLLDEGERLVPGFRRARLLRVWTGVRPLFDGDRAQEEGGRRDGESRDITRAHALLDHGLRDGVAGFVTITGGKLTTLRLMAQQAVDAACRQLGEQRPCHTDTEPLPGSRSGRHLALGDRLARKEAAREEQLICECELVPRSWLELAIRQAASSDLDDVRRQLRLGMGPCQGGFCIYRAAGILHEVGELAAAETNASLRAFLQERWKGVWPVLHGDQLRQARLDEWIFHGLLAVGRLPAGEART